MRKTIVFYRMTNWFPFNYRDTSAWHGDNLPLTTASNEAAKLLDCLIAQVNFHENDPVYGDVEATMAKMTQADPDFVMGQTVALTFQLLGSSGRKNPKMIYSVNNFVDKARTRDISQWEQKHLKCLAHLAKEDLLTCGQIWEDILIDHPLDMHALEMLFLINLLSGRKEGLRNCAARVVDEYPKTDKFYGNVYGKLCFGYEECGQFDEAERAGSMALDHTPNDIWTIHSLTHVREETMRAREGLKFLEDTGSQWKPRSGFTTHVWWHTSIFHVQLGEYEQALTVYDEKIEPGARKEKASFPLSDATALMMRLQLENQPQGLELKDRWRELANIYSDIVDDTVTDFLFYDFHALLACLYGQDKTSANKIVDRITSFSREASKYPDSWSSHVNGKVGVPLARGLVAFGEANYSEAVEHLHPIRHDWMTYLGGSHAQKDILNQVLIQAAIRAGMTRTAKQLLQERLAFSAGHSAEESESSLNQRLIQKVLTSH